MMVGDGNLSDGEGICGSISGGGEDSEIGTGSGEGISEIALSECKRLDSAANT